MQEEQEPDPPPDQELDPSPEPADPAFNFTAGEDAKASKAAEAKKKKVAKQKEQRDRKAREKGRVPGGDSRGRLGARRAHSLGRVGARGGDYSSQRDPPLLAVRAAWFET